MEDGDSNNAICWRSNKFDSLTKNIILYYITTRCSMKTDKYASKLNGTAVFVKGYSAGVRMHVETSNAPFFAVVPVPPVNYSEPQFHKSPVMNSCKEKKQLFPWLRHQ